MAIRKLVSVAKINRGSGVKRRKMHGRDRCLVHRELDSSGSVWIKEVGPVLVPKKKRGCKGLTHVARCLCTVRDGRDADRKQDSVGHSHAGEGGTELAKDTKKKGEPTTRTQCHH